MKLIKVSRQYFDLHGNILDKNNFRDGQAPKNNIHAKCFFRVKIHDRTHYFGTHQSYPYPPKMTLARCTSRQALVALLRFECLREGISSPLPQRLPHWQVSFTLRYIFHLNFFKLVVLDLVGNRLYKGTQKGASKSRF